MKVRIIFTDEIFKPIMEINHVKNEDNDFVITSIGSTSKRFQVHVKKYNKRRYKYKSKTVLSKNVDGNDWIFRIGEWNIYAKKYLLKVNPIYAKYASIILFTRNPYEKNDDFGKEQYIYDKNKEQ